MKVYARVFVLLRQNGTRRIIPSEDLRRNDPESCIQNIDYSLTLAGLISLFEKKKQQEFSSVLFPEIARANFLFINKYYHLDDT